MSRTQQLSRLALTSIVTVLLCSPALADSHVRIVRLSSVEGQVQIDRGTGSGLERAILNTPIVEGTRLVTGNDGLAEVEFENESALRIADNSEVSFSQLLLSDTGAKVTQVEVAKGVVYLEATSKGNDVYRVKAGNTVLVAHRDALLRLSVTPAELKAAVLKGEVQVDGGAQPLSVHKKETLTVALDDPSKSTVAGGVESSRYDSWNKEREDYSKTYAENQGYGGPNRAYGLQDLNYYGNFFYAGGYGYVWQPYGFAGSMATWDPYSNGAWMFYPGLGYAWASAYPWGWLPFHYGSWAFINGAGWAWVPGGGYNGQWYAGNFMTVPRVLRAPANWTAAAPPAVLPGTTTPRTVTVGTVNPAALTIAGGRTAPNFGSLVPGRTAVAANQGFARPATASGHAPFAERTPTTNTAHQGHVFAPPTRSVGLTAPEMGGMRGVGSPMGGPAAHGTTGSAGGHSASGAAHK
jgi:hypothetical protein